MKHQVGDRFVFTDLYFATYSQMDDFLRPDPILTFECGWLTYFFNHPARPGGSIAIPRAAFENWLAKGMVEKLPTKRTPDYMAIIREMAG